MMKKLLCCLLVLSVLLVSVPAAVCAESYNPSITKTFSRGQSDEYRYWTMDSTQLALLAILLAEDMMREDYTAYNSCFPISSVSCVLYHSGKRKDNKIKVMYVCADAYLSVVYNIDKGKDSYTIDRQMPDIASFPSYVSKNGGSYDSSWYNYYNFDLYDPTPAYLMASEVWSNYHDHHPELDSNLPRGW